MASGGGFSFGNTNTLGNTQTGIGATGGFSCGTAAQPATTATATGLGGAAAGTAGFGFGTVGGAAAKPGATTGFSLGGATSTATSTAAATGFSLGGTAPTASTGFSLTKTTAAPLTLGAPATSTAGGGFSFGATPSTTTALTLGAKTTAAPLTLGAATTASTGFGFGVKPATSTTASGLGGTLTGFTAAPATSANVGLGGVDPKATGSGAGASGSSGKPSDNKAVKECALPQQICLTVAEFKKFVKNEKSVRENIARMSSKPLYRVQEEVASLKQLLSVVATGLQRNASAIEKLKRESVQELKYAEMAQRTKDTPPGLQYENVAPTEYFHSIAEKFESQMVLYRQQIEEMESHLSSMQHGDALSPQDLANLLNKLHESFVILAAQLQAVHEAVKAQKDQYLNYRKVFLGDSTNIFEKRRKIEEKTGTKVGVGPTPFTGMSNATALAMASALNRTQQPQGAAALQPGTGLFGAAQPMAPSGGLFGTAAAATNTGTGIFGSSAQPQPAGLFGAKTAGFTGFGATATTTAGTGFSFAAPVATVPPLGALGSTNTGTGIGFGTTPQTTQASGFSFGQSNTGFQLQNPPAGLKRAKKP